LDVSACDNVSNGTEGGSLDGVVGVHEELNQSAHNTGFDDLVDLLIGSVRQVGDGPADVGEDLVVIHQHKASEDGESRADLEKALKFSSLFHASRSYNVPVRDGILATAKVGQGPGCVTCERELVNGSTNCRI